MYSNKLKHMLPICTYFKARVLPACIISGIPFIDRYEV